MRDQKRIKRILKLLERYWIKQPDLRFGQILINSNICNDEYRLWSNEDEDLEEYLKELLKETENK